MNRKLFNRSIEIARALKPKLETGRSFHVSFAIKKGKIIKLACNNYNKLHNINRFPRYINWRNLPGEYKASLHSESALAIKMGEEDWSDYELLNIRIGNLNQPLNSCPCPNCLKSVIIPLQPKKVFYSDNEGSYKELILK